MILLVRSRRRGRVLFRCLGSIRLHGMSSMLGMMTMRIVLSHVNGEWCRPP